MPIQVSWADAEQTIVIMNYDGSWTWEELYQASREIEGLTDGKKRVVPVIHNLSGSRSLPKDVFFHGQRLTVEVPKGGLFVIVGAGTFARIVVDTLRRLNKGFDDQFKTAATVDAALILIKQYQANNP